MSEYKMLAGREGEKMSTAKGQRGGELSSVSDRENAPLSAVSLSG